MDRSLGAGGMILGVSDPELANYARAQAKEGRCCACGFLSRRIRPEPPSGTTPAWGFYEVDHVQRGDLHRLFLFMPLACFRGVANLQTEIGGDDAATYAVIWRDRHCEHWKAYRPGISPREHLAEPSKLRAMWLEFWDLLDEYWPF